MEAEVEIQLVVEVCPSCKGRGWLRTMTMGSDNMDVSFDTDVCSNCDGHIYMDAEYLEVAV